MNKYLKKKKVVLGVIVFIVTIVLMLHHPVTGGIISNWWTRTKFFSELETVVVRGDVNEFKRKYKYKSIQIISTDSSGEVIAILRRCKSSFFSTCDTSKEGLYPVKKGKVTRFE